MSYTGLSLTLAGMLTVFSFLLLLVFVMSLSSRIILRFFNEQESKPKPEKVNKSDTAIAIAIAAAVAKKEGKIK